MSELPQDLAIPFLGIFLKGLETELKPKHTNMHSTTATTAKNWENRMSLSGLTKCGIADQEGHTQPWRTKHSTMPHTHEPGTHYAK